MAITLAGVADEQALLPLMAAFNRTEEIVWRPKSMGPALHRLLGDHELGLVLVARQRSSQSVVGYGLATFGYDLEFAGRDAFITELFVAEANRGFGVGSALLDALIDALRRREAKAVHLMVRPENRRARVLYARRGFQVAPRIMMTRKLVEEDD